ncbi:MAG TPA: MbcA/ParS/Xre antitoxin family protein [Anaerovoracaceae bacterium]|nr:MbcA/ParS/Xre antitoxin family protein [Anaerovoracaceae bacterium]
MAGINLSELGQCLELLQDIFGNKDTAIEWLNFPHPHLGTSPMLAIAGGKAQAVLKILRQMQTKQLS